MKQWMVVCIAAVMATALSFSTRTIAVGKVRTAGLPQGWVSDGLLAGVDEVAVERPSGGGAAELVISKRSGRSARPLFVYQTIDAAPWRGRTLSLRTDMLVQVDSAVMRRAFEPNDIELRMECDGAKPGIQSMDRTERTRVWWSMDENVDVPGDAAYCTIGIVARVESHIRIRGLRLKDYAAEREAFLARRWPEPSRRNILGGRIFPSAVTSITPFNQELAQ